MGAAQGPAPECFPGLSDRGLSKLSPRPEEAMDRYLSGPVPSEDIVRDATTAKEAAWQLLMTAAAAFGDEGTPYGCLLATATASCSAAPADVQADLREIRLGGMPQEENRGRHRDWRASAGNGRRGAGCA